MEEKSAAVENSRKRSDLNSNELIGMVGFALYFGWMLVCFYWFFGSFFQNQGMGTGYRDVIKSFVFLVTITGYL